MKALGTLWEPRWAKMDQDGAKMAQDGAKMGQDGAKMAQDGVKMAQDGAKMEPRWTQDGANKPALRRSASLR